MRAPEILPVSAIIATLGRAKSLAQTLDSLKAQSCLPRELIVVDASADRQTEDLCRSCELPGTTLRYVRAKQAGAASQRNEGIALSGEDFVLFADDDIDFDADCIKRLWAAVQSSPRVGAANAMIHNQRFVAPGLWTRALYQLVDDEVTALAGRCFGPAVNVLPEDAEGLPTVVPVDWLNTTCVLYRREALPNPVFDSIFEGASTCEDLCLSLRVGRDWELVNARTGRIFHHCRTGIHKADCSRLIEMEITNRYYIMRNLLGKHSRRDRFDLALVQLFQLAGAVRLGGVGLLPGMVSGYARGMLRVAEAGGKPDEGDFSGFNESNSTP